MRDSEKKEVQKPKLYLLIQSAAIIFLGLEMETELIWPSLISDQNVK